MARGTPFKWMGTILLAQALQSCGVGAESLLLSADPVPLHAVDDGAQETVGALTYRGGLHLRALSGDFGGLSGLEVSADGRRMTAVSDRGFWFTATLGYDRGGRLASVADATLVPMRGIDGAVLAGRRDTDAEAVRADGTGGLLVSFEQRHRIRRYPADVPLADAVPEAVSTPPELAEAPSNGGIEALAVLPDGGILALTEKFETGDGRLRGWVLHDDDHRPFTYPLDDRFHPTDATVLGGDTVLVLERRFVPPVSVSARLRSFPVDALAAGAALAPRTLAVLEHPMTVDNYEGLAVVEGDNGEVRVYIVSDDNYSLLQRTLLLMFVLRDD